MGWNEEVYLDFAAPMLDELSKDDAYILKATDRFSKLSTKKFRHKNYCRHSRKSYAKLYFE